MSSPTTQKVLWIGLFVAIVLGILWQFFPLKDAQNRLDALPLNAPGVEGKNLPITPLELEFFKNVNMIKRSYLIGDQKAFIYILDGTHNRHAVHDPVYCFRGGGYEILSKRPYALKNGEGSLYVISKGKEKREALLWFSDGTSHFNSPVRYWLSATLRRLTLGASGPEPVLIVIQPIGEDKPLEWDRLLQDFPQLLEI